MNNKGFHLSVKAVSKQKGHSIVSKIAYNSGEKLEEKSTGITHDYTSKQEEKTLLLRDKDGNVKAKKVDKNLVHSAIILPENCKNISVNREQFWNEINDLETRKNAQTGTELVMMFPKGLDEKGRINLANKMGQKLADRYNSLVDYSIHAPHSHEQKTTSGEVIERTTDNDHLHMIIAPREILPEPDNSYSLSKRKSWNLWSTKERLIKGLNGRGDELKYQRKLWADLANEMLPEQQHISEKSYRERGINQLPTRKLGKTLYRDILQGNTSIIQEYNEVINDINKYLELNDLQIDYNDNGRIDNEVNEQEITYKKGSYKIEYKKRKPFKNPDLTKIKIIDLNKDLTHEENKENLSNVLDDFMNFGEQLENSKKLERTALFTQLDGLSEQLSKQSQRYITRQKSIDVIAKNDSDLGKDFKEDIEQHQGVLDSISVYEDIEKIKTYIQRIDEFIKDETKQTSEQVTLIKDAIKSIDNNVKLNDNLLENTVEEYNEFINEFKELVQLDKQHKKEVAKLDNKLIKLEILQENKQEYLQDWQQAFSHLKDIEVTNNLDTYNKFADYAEFDENKLDELIEKSKEIDKIKAINIDENTQKQIDELHKKIDEFKQSNDDDIRKLSSQIKTSIKTYERLEPLYSEREELLETSLAVIQQDDDLHDEITTTKTTQLNIKKLQEWQERTQALHARLVREHELREQAKKEQAEREEQERLARIEQQRHDEKQAYNERIKTFFKNVIDEVAKLNFRELNAPDTLIESAEKLAISSIIRDGLQHTDRLTESQKLLNDRQYDSVKKQSDIDTDDLFNELEKIPNNSSKINTIERLNDRFKSVLELQPNNEKILQINEQLDKQIEHIKEHINEQSRSYSPRP